MQKDRIPDYVYQLPDIFWKYFEEENFKGKPYPVNRSEASEFLLYEVFKVDKQEVITLETEENGEPIKTGFDRTNYHRVFDHNHWQKLDVQAKVTALYWFFEEISKELNVYKPQLIFSSAENSYQKNANCVKIDFTEKSLKSAYNLLDCICHELKHANVDHTFQEDYFLSTDAYLSAKSSNKKSDTPMDRYRQDFEYYLYFFQPKEIGSWDYAYKRTRQVFLENKKANKGSFCDEDAEYFHSVTCKHKGKLRNKELMFENEDEFKEQLDKRYLLTKLKSDVNNLKYEILMNNSMLDFENETLIAKVIDKEKAKNLQKEYKLNLDAVKSLTEEIDEDFKKIYARTKRKVINDEVSLINK